MSKRLITESDIVGAAKQGIRSLHIEPDTIITPSARDAAGRLRISLEQGTPSDGSTTAVGSVTIHAPEKGVRNLGVTVAVGADHGGYQLKEQIKKYLLETGYAVADVGTRSEQACDYPDFAYAVARMVAAGQAERGVMVDAVGVASAIVANKVRGIRAVPAYNEFVARSSREHNDANVLTLGGRVLGVEVAKSIVRIWLETWFGGGRHQSRVAKIADIEDRFSK